MVRDLKSIFARPINCCDRQFRKVSRLDSNAVYRWNKFTTIHFLNR